MKYLDKYGTEREVMPIYFGPGIDQRTVSSRRWWHYLWEIKPVPEKKVVRAAVELYESGGVKSSSITLVPAGPEKKKPFVADAYSQMGLGL